MAAPVWRKSGRSTQGTSDQCVEVAKLARAIGLRDSKNPAAGHLCVSIASFAELIARVKRDDLSL